MHLGRQAQHEHSLGYMYGLVALLPAHTSLYGTIVQVEGVKGKAASGLAFISAPQAHP